MADVISIFILADVPKVEANVIFTCHCGINI